MPISGYLARWCTHLLCARTHALCTKRTCIWDVGMHSSSARHVATGSVRFGEKDTRLYYVCMYMSVCLSPAFNFLEAYGCGHHERMNARRVGYLGSVKSPTPRLSCLMYIDELGTEKRKVNR
ncbi:hypothetical protein F4824DRAFT_468962 [Ustulina deusta]|nr:hypothetical protein F4824DRAFT_468962 [Ustulina deusta]